ncbi:MAG: DEAD/DEAH box helicase [Pseudomonadota bacterium]
MTTFNNMGLPQLLLNSLQKMGFDQPTPIQAQSIPLALEGRDILGSAQTGTGKTGAFGIPLVTYLLNNPQASALVITPTRELASQVLTQLDKMLTRDSQVKSALLIGGDPMPKQLQHLKRHPRLVVGTPGRINDHLTRGTLKLAKTSFIVMDETDRMLDMGFSIQIDNICSHLPAKRQTLMFSATLPPQIIGIANKYLNNPERVAVKASEQDTAKIEQKNINTPEGNKFMLLLEQLEERKGSVIVFVKTKHATEKLAKRLAVEGEQTSAIHGDLRQSKRDRVIKGFRQKKYRILVATDVAARGLDVPHIEHVINYDLPQCPEDYIHRIGRTARKGGAQGSALNLIAPGDNKKWDAIYKLLNPKAVVRAKRDVGRKQGKFNQRPQQQRRRFSKSPAAGSRRR